MNKLLLILLASFFFLPLASAEYSGVLKVRSKDYTCGELKQLVQDEGVVRIKYFGSLDVYADQSQACINTFCSRDTPCEAYQSNWKTQDKRFCRAGYSCRRSNRRDR